MKALSSVLAIAVMAISATVSAQVVYTPSFPSEKPVQAQTKMADAPAETPRQQA